MKPHDPDALLEWLQRWYEGHCDDDWEHQYGVSIDTLDNPGWRVRIDLKGTALEGRSLEQVRMDKNEADWLHYWAEDDRFEAAGGPRKLSAILQSLPRVGRGVELSMPPHG